MPPRLFAHEIFLCFYDDMLMSLLFVNLFSWVGVFHKVRKEYRKVSNISRTLVGNKIVDHSDVVGASPALLQLHLYSQLNGLGKDNCKTRRETFRFWDCVLLVLENWWYLGDIRALVTMIQTGPQGWSHIWFMTLMTASFFKADNLFLWFSARLQYLQYLSYGDTAVLP